MSSQVSSGGKLFPQAASRGVPFLKEGGKGCFNKGKRIALATGDHLEMQKGIYLLFEG